LYQSDDDDEEEEGMRRTG